MKKVILILTLFILNSAAYTQEQLLQQKISVDFKDITIYNALQQIEQKAHIYFSYDNQLIKNQRKISVAKSNAPVKVILDLLLGKDYYYMVNKTRVIIRKSEVNPVFITGVVIDAATQQPLENVSLYIAELQVGTISDARGYFTLSVPNLKDTRLNLSHISYADTFIVLHEPAQQLLRIPLSQRIQPEPELILSSVQRHWLAKKLVGKKSLVNSKNLKNYFYQRKFRIGILPGIATKNALLGQQENHLSFNLLGGYSAQVDAFEFGSLFNVVQKHVHAVQIGGLANIVGGTVNGFQFGGIYNYVWDTVKGLQVAGFYNRTEIVSGMQFSVFFNKSRKVDGLQAGLVNIADTIKGIGLGPVNYYKNGKHSLTLSTNENGQRMIGYRSGIPRFYNILQLGWIHMAKSTDYYMVGYGWGSEWPLHSKVKIAAELISGFYTPSKKINFDYNNISLQPLFIYTISPKFQLFAGPRIQYQLSVKDPENADYQGFRRNMLMLNRSQHHPLSLGFSAGIAIF